MGITKNKSKTTAKPKQVKKPPRYVTFAEYINLRHKADLRNDPLASPLYHINLNKAVERGAMEIHEENGTKWIDWNKYGTLLFKRSFQMPVPKTKKK